MTAQLILASASPRRREILDQIGIRYHVQAAALDESVLAGETPLAYVERIAAAKSALVEANKTLALPVLAADTTVVCDQEILGKPENEAQALSMLLKLSGRTHQVFTAVSLRAHNPSDADNNSHWQTLSITQVTFRALSLSEISAYWQSGEPVDKAGAYAIQGLGSVFVSAINGSFSGVVGLPIFETVSLLTQVGINVLHD